MSGTWSHAGQIIPQAFRGFTSVGQYEVTGQLSPNRAVHRRDSQGPLHVDSKRPARGRAALGQRVGILERGLARKKSF
jgi:hypothetical protein